MNNIEENKFRIALESDQIITLERIDGRISDQFKILKTYACGHSCLVYQAIILENGKPDRPILLKEFYPISFANSIERNSESGALTLQTKDNQNFIQSFQEDKAKFWEACEKQKNFYLTHVFNADNLIEVQAMYTLGDSVYIVNPAVGGTNWEQTPDENLYQIFETAIAILHELNILHKSGLIHCDIKPENVYILPGHRKKVILLDFDGVQTLKNGALTGMEQLYYSKEYTSPEILNAKDQQNEIDCLDYYSCIGPKSDLYSVAATIYKKIIGEPVPRGTTKTAETLRDKALSDFWKRERLNKLKYISVRVKEELKKFFNVMLAINPKTRFDIVEMERQLKRIMDMTSIPKLLLSSSCKVNFGAQFFFGRKNELEQLSQLLNKNIPVIFVFGERGLGKSTLVLQTAWIQREFYDFYWTSFNEDLEKTVAYLPVEPACYTDSESKKDIKILYTHNLKCLQGYGNSSVLIIDNFDLTSDKAAEVLHSKAYDDLMKLDMKIIFTCRHRPTNFGNCIEISEMDESELLEMIHSNYHGTDSENIFPKLIEYANKNTFVVEQMAKILEESWGELTPKKLLEKLQNSANDSYEGKIYNCIRTLFDISVLSDKAKEIMAKTNLFPISGINAAIFLRCHEDTQSDKIRILELSGWLKKTPDNFLKVHSLVGDVCAKEIPQNDAVCKIFIEKYLTEFQKLEVKDWMAQRFQRVEILSNAADSLEDNDGIYAEKAGDFNYAEGMYFQALKYYETRWKIFLKKNPEPEPFEALKLLYNVANSAYGMSEYRYAIYCAHSALKLAEKEVGTDCPKFFPYYVNLGNIYMEYGDLDNAQKCYQKALNLYETNNFKDTLDKAQVYLNLTKLYIRRGNNDLAKTYGNMTMDILSKFRNAPLLLASLLESFSILSRRAGDYHGELEYSNQAISIYETVMGKEHPRTIASYNNKANALMNLGREDEAAECLRSKVSEIESIYGINHNYTAKMYYNLARIFNKKGDTVQALSWCEKALNIHNKIFGEFHPITLSTSRALWVELKK